MNKPFIDYKNRHLTNASSNLLRKRFTRYIHKIQTEKSPKIVLFNRKHVKLIYSISVPHAHLIEPHQLFKVLKPLKSLVTLSIGTQRRNEVNHLCYLRILNHIKKLHLIFNGPEEILFEDFAIPKKIQGLTLDLRSFDLGKFLPERKLKKYDFEEDSNFKNFFRQWNRLDRLQDMKLIFCLSGAAGVVSLFCQSILKQISCLKSLGYKQVPWTSSPYAEQTFDLGYFWKAIASSRNSLENLDIHVPHISPFSLEDISIEMPRLKRINLDVVDQSYFANKITKVWRECPLIKSQNVLLSLNLRGIIIHDDGMLQRFLASFADIEDNPSLTLEILVRKATPVLLTTLCEFLAQTKIQGSIYVRTGETRLCECENLGMIENAAVNNKTLKLFELREGGAVEYKREPRNANGYRMETRFAEFLQVEKGEVTRGNRVIGCEWVRK